MKFNTDVYPILQRLTVVQETLAERHSELEALLEVLVHSDLSEYSRVILHNYLWGLRDMAEQTRRLSEGSLDMVLGLASVFDPFQGPFGTGSLH